jgi:hypothetical protein
LNAPVQHFDCPRARISELVRILQGSRRVTSVTDVLERNGLGRESHRAPGSEHNPKIRVCSFGSSLSTS